MCPLAIAADSKWRRPERRDTGLHGSEYFWSSPQATLVMSNDW
jgi:hypothetical protein